MTCGIYKLNFENTDKVYIGKGVEIEHRYANHKHKLLTGTHSKKMQKAFENFGMPSLEILIKCSIEDAAKLENETILKYNSVDNGFNTLYLAEDTPDGSSTPGDLHGMSKYSNEKILEVFKLLIIEPCIPLTRISETTGVSYRVVSHISSCESHKWISLQFPIEYAKLLELKGTRFSTSNSAISRGVVYLPIKSPEGTVYNVTHLTNFCKEHNLDPSSLSKVMKSKAKSHKGWKVVQ